MRDGVRMPSWPTICCMRLSVRSLSVSANFTTRLEEAPCGGRSRERRREVARLGVPLDLPGVTLGSKGGSVVS